MNTQQLLSILLLSLLAGCGDSTSSFEPSPEHNDNSSKVASSDPPTLHERSVVNLTDAAITKFKEALLSQPTKHIRLSVKNDGPTGFRYDLQLDNSINKDDIVDKSHGFILVVDPKSSILLEGATIDWQTQPDGQAGFKFDNPNAVDDEIGDH